MSSGIKYRFLIFALDVALGARVKRLFFRLCSPDARCTASRILCIPDPVNGNKHVLRCLEPRGKNRKECSPKVQVPCLPFAASGRFFRQGLRLRVQPHFCIELLLGSSCKEQCWPILASFRGMEAAHSWACSAKTLSSNREAAARLVSLSARSLCPTANAATALRVGRRCLNDLDGVLAVAMKIPPAAEEQRLRVCRRRSCTRPLVSFRHADITKQARERERLETAKERLALGGIDNAKIQKAVSADDGGDWPAPQDWN